LPSEEYPKSLISLWFNCPPTNIQKVSFSYGLLAFRRISIEFHSLMVYLSFEEYPESFISLCSKIPRSFLYTFISTNAIRFTTFTTILYSGILLHFVGLTYEYSITLSGYLQLLLMFNHLLLFIVNIGYTSQPICPSSSVLFRLSI
jgi:hypothetical protein